MEELWLKKIVSFFPTRIFVDKTTFISCGFNKIIDFATTYILCNIFVDFISKRLDLDQMGTK